MRHLLRLLLLALALLPAGSVRAQSRGGWWAQILRPADLWSGPSTPAESFGQLPRGHYVFVPDAQPFPGGGRVYVQEAAESAFGYVDAIALAPSGPPAELGGALPPLVATPLFRPFWIANHTAAQFWADPNEGGETLGDLPPFSKLLVLAPAVGQRYYVQDARSERLGYVDAALIGPSDPPVPGEYDPPPSLVPPTTEPSFRPTWVAVLRPTELWSGPQGGTSFGRIAAGEHVLVMGPASGPRLHVLNPETRNYAFVDAAATAPSPGPKPAAIAVNGWKGTLTGDIVNLRPEPNTFVPHVAQARLGDEVTVAAWTEGEELERDNRTWARVTSIKRRDFQGQQVELLTGDFALQPYVYSGLLRPAVTPELPARPATALGNGGARWIDVNLTRQMVVAYEGEKAVYSALVTSGRPGWETPVGTHRIQRRVENETMIGSTLLRLDTFEIPDYRLENVKWTQYFTGGGAALHTNYWRPAGLFGMPSSHGCVGLLEKDAKWLRDWARVGTPLLVHY